MKETHCHKYFDKRYLLLRIKYLQTDWRNIKSYVKSLKVNGYPFDEELKILQSIEKNIEELKLIQKNIDCGKLMPDEILP